MYKPMLTRKVIFWILFLPLGLLVFFGDLLCLIGEFITKTASNYEDWTFGYTKSGWKHIEGGGAWTKDWRDEE